MFEKSIDTSAAVHELLVRRWSGVAYDPDRPLHREDLLALAEAARWAPSCFGDQPWRYIFCHQQDDPTAWDKAYDCLSEGNQTWNRSVPLLIITCCDSLFSQRGTPNPLAEYDTGAASMSICLQAAALGLMTHQMAGFDPARAREHFAIPERYKPLAFMAVGYQLPAEQVPEQFRERENKPRNRNPLQDHFFAGEWGKGLE